MTEDIERWRLRVERERLARKEAERLLEEKSWALYNANRDLQSLAASLESEVASRTAELPNCRAAGCAGARQRRHPCQKRFSGHHEPRDSHPDEWHSGHDQIVAVFLAKARAACAC
jgi:hypothetical protein